MSTVLTLALAEAQPGMVLGAPVTDRNGTILLPAGTTLTENHLVSLGRRSIETLLIIAPEDPADQERQREAIRQRVMHLFRHATDDPGAQALLHAVLAFRMKRLQ
ncbi:hypothetical protein [Zoogloea sp.]|uniref:hypothetical protein n=1 Tax=Zoogloea sp. TaxID=49181 RepID=UPI0026127395|nr:hypothetical protein [Zoogloea sp.]MDD3353190.1 hypothetical protein [Zoogloea sp.]